ncbi:MAG TPA: phosphatidate cytidylyltransferase [Bacteroidetes bacterium]|nr:phosphatidate cytidylyltransferase [Bacteroidota bacterium]
MAVWKPDFERGLNVPFAQLKSRVLVVLVGAPLIIAIVLIGKIPFLLLTSLILIVSLYEFYQLAQKKGAFPDVMLSIFAALLLIWDMYFYSSQHFLPILSGFTIVVVILQLRQTKGSQIINLATNFLGVVYLGVLLSFFIGIRELPLKFNLDYGQGGYWTLAILITIWIGDSVAYFAGSSIGKHKLAKRISPKKTVEGAIGGFFGMLIVIFISRFAFSLNWTLLDTLVIGIICGTIGQISDLAESQFKRDAGVKDSSNLLPGHGGMFDRFDVLFLTPPVIYYYLAYFSSLAR